MTLSSFLTAMLPHCPGPKTGRACWEAGARQQSENDCCLDGAAARHFYKLNRTKVDAATRVISATHDADFLHNVVTRERRSTLVSAALSNPNCTLRTVIIALTGEIRSGRPNLRYVGTTISRAIRNMARDEGPAATLDLLIPTIESSRGYVFIPSLGALTGLGQDVELMQRCLEANNMHEHLDVLCRSGMTYSDEVLDWLIDEAPLQAAVTLTRFDSLRDRRPDMLERLYQRARAVWQADAATPRHVNQLFVSMALSTQPEPRYRELADMDISPVLVALSSNPKAPVGVLHDVTAKGSMSDRGSITGRCIAERFGDTPEAFLLAAQLLEHYSGTYGELCDFVAAALGSPRHHEATEG